MPKGSKRDNCFVDSVIERSRLEAQLEREELILKHNLKQQEEMNVQLNSLEGLQYKVFRLRFIDKLSVNLVAEKLDMNTRTVDRIIARIKHRKKEGA